MLPFPKEHREITHQLLNGKFILGDENLYQPVHENKEMYADFFSKTFDYELVINSEYAYLKSTNEKDKSSRDFLVFLALLCRELDKDGKDFKKEIEEGKFLVDDMAAFLTDSSKKKEIIHSTSMTDHKGEIDLINFLNEWSRRNVIRYFDSTKSAFRFTGAIGMFFDFATSIAHEKLSDVKPKGKK